MLKSGLIGAVNKLFAVLEIGEIVVDLEKCFGRFTEYNLHYTRGGINVHEINFILEAVHPTDGKQVRIFGPLHPGDVLIVFGTFLNFDCFSGRQIIHGHIHSGVFFSRFRVFEGVVFRIQSAPHLHVVGRHLALIKTHEGDFL